jgi:hypothetical protein
VRVSSDGATAQLAPSAFGTAAGLALPLAQPPLSSTRICLRLRCTRDPPSVRLELGDSGGLKLVCFPDGELRARKKLLAQGPRWDQPDRDYKLQVSDRAAAAAHSPATSVLRPAQLPAH